MDRTRRFSVRSVAALTVLSVLVVVGPRPATAATPTDRVLIYRAGSASDVFWTPEGTTPTSITQTYQSIVGDFVGDTTQDILWYRPGTATDVLWKMQADGSHTSIPISISGTYTPVVGIFKEGATGANDHDDILFYAPGPTPDPLWVFNNDGTITRSALSISGTYTPIVGGFKWDDGATTDLSDDILWLKPNGVSSLWDFNRDGSITQTAHSLGSAAQPLVLRSPSGYNLFLYRPGSGADDLYDFAAGTIAHYSIVGTYIPVVGGFDTRVGSFESDILWYAPGPKPDPLWNFVADSPVVVTTLHIDGTYTPVVGRYTAGASSGDDILWYRGTGSGSSAYWNGSNGDGTFTSSPVTLPSGGSPILIRT
ncbi:MAG: hypothetical protein JWM89_1262 [Acidimicrobiales bacterium]|nr:hypothetical protein [Acidimicrobiales bacterium]